MATGGLGSVVGAVRAHPYIAGFMLFCVVSGAVTGVFVLTEEWSIARRLAGGAIGGVWVGFLLTATRMLGAWS